MYLAFYSFASAQQKSNSITETKQLIKDSAGEDEKYLRGFDEQSVIRQLQNEGVPGKIQRDNKLSQKKIY